MPLSDLPILDPSAKTRTAQPKPRKGTSWLQSKATAAERKAHERREMEAAKKRDGHKCRFPRCEYLPKKPRIDCAHLTHRGMGGNKSGDRTTRDQLVALCLVHHAEFDKRWIDIEPMTKHGTDGPCAFYRVSESGKWQHVATEKSIGISEARR